MNENIPSVRLDARLATAASFVRKGAVVADIGTDHAYLPIYLLQKGVAKAAVAADINEGPLARAKADAALFGMGDSLSFCLSDGLESIDLAGLGVTDVVICGMGGELIAHILDRSPYVKNEAVRLILQPMTAGDDLRAYLDRAGFAVIDERLSLAGGKYYCCICAEYDGVLRQSSPAQLLLGKKTIENHEPLFEGYVAAHLKRLETKIAGMKKGGLDTAAEEVCRNEILEIQAQRKEKP